ncbi:MAG: hypothetical protein HC886_08765 [Leptolyngbyaceae cyanobacterium SM1_1_3]|nr:hypothetical protein [Leptolyngbyaceae cyanobacterium SM1_1_3]
MVSDGAAGFAGQPQVQALSSDRNLDLERTSLLRAELLGCLSHELKTPLTSLLGLSKLLQDPRLGALSDRQNRYAALIYQNARSLKATVNEILDLTRIESGRMTLTVKSIQIADLCHQALLQAEDYNRARGDGETRSHPLTLDRFHLKIELGLECLSVDELRLRQILIHLLSNALRCTPENGGLGLTVERQGGWILLSVWDTGVGIPTAQQRFIFHRLQRIENPLTQRFTGPGLGLILVRQLAQLQGGEISFVSRASQGSKFTLLLPMASTLSEAIARPLPAAANSGLVVVLEQDPTHIETIAQALEPSGYWPAIARSSQETLEKVRRLRPPVVLIDLRADDLNSEWLTQQLRAEAEEPLTLVAIAPSNTPLPHGGRFDHVLHLPLAANMLHQLFTQLKLATEPTLAAATVLLLKQSNALGGPLNSLDQLLQQYQCRVLEVDDIDQARLLAKIWHPQVILLDPDISDPDSYLRRLSQQPSLSSLPVVTLTNEMTQLANRFPGLKIFPCLAPLSNLSSAAPSSPLLEVIQVAIQACQQL